MPANSEDMNKYVEKRYNDAIKYYWKASRHNKRAYKLTRSLTLILGAVVTLIASISSIEFVRDIPFWGYFIIIATPVLAAILAISGGFSQTFQWGAAWQDMIITAEQLQKECDRFIITKPEERDLAKEVSLLNDFVLAESQGFFQRMLGSAKPPKVQI